MCEEPTILRFPAMTTSQLLSQILKTTTEPDFPSSAPDRPAGERHIPQAHAVIHGSMRRSLAPQLLSQTQPIFSGLLTQLYIVLDIIQGALGLNKRLAWRQSGLSSFQVRPETVFGTITPHPVRACDALNPDAPSSECCRDAMLPCAGCGIKGPRSGFRRHSHIQDSDAYKTRRRPTGEVCLVLGPASQDRYTLRPFTSFCPEQLISSHIP
jgi:hypothetical protein